MAVLIDHQSISVNPGTRVFERATSPGTVLVRLARQTTARLGLWVAGVHVEIWSEWSADGGTTWRDLCGAGADGGIVVDGRTGLEIPETRFQCEFPPAANRVRLTATVSGARLTSEITLEVL